MINVANVAYGYRYLSSLELRKTALLYSAVNAVESLYFIIWSIHNRLSNCAVAGLTLFAVEHRRQSVRLII